VFFAAKSQEIERFMPVVAEQRAQSPASSGPQPELPGQTFALRAFVPEAKEQLERQAPEIAAVMDRARDMLLHFIPEMKPVLERPGLQVVVVDNVREAWKQTYGSYPDPHDYRDLDAFTHTIIDPKTKQATGTVIFLSSQMFREQRLNDGEWLNPVPHVISVLDHELHHCQQPIHPPNGQVVGEMSVGRREQDAYAGEIRDLQRIYAGVSPLDVRDYRSQFGHGDLDGEKIVDEKVNFRYLAAHLEVLRERYETMAKKDEQAAMPALPKVEGAHVPPGEKGAAEFVVPKNSPYYSAIASALDSGLRVQTTSNPRVPFQILDKDSHLLRNVLASSSATTPELLSQVLALQLQAQTDSKELFGLLTAQGWGFRAKPFETGQPTRYFDILELIPGANPAAGASSYQVRTTVGIKPSAENRAVLEIGDDLYQAWESDLLREVKGLLSATKK